MDKQGVVYTYNEIVFNFKKEGSSDTWITWMNLEDMISLNKSVTKRQARMIPLI